MSYLILKVLHVVTGFAAAIVARIPILGSGWILWPIVLFSMSGIVFGVRVAPLQRRILEAARAADATDAAWQARCSTTFGS